MKWCAFFLGVDVLLSSPAAARPDAPPPAPAQRQAAPAQPQATPAPAGVSIPVRLTAKTLTSICNENQGACLTYVLGAVDASVAASVVNFGRTYICIPPEVTNQQVANVAIAFLRAHPEAQDSSAASVVIQGVTASYPCR
jgi:hypothetical protein